MMVIRRKAPKDKYLVGLSDIHFGAKTARTDLAERARDWILKHDAWVWDLGDVIELATRYSVGAGVYEQTRSPDAQIDWAIEFYKPIVERELLIGMVDSNHQARSYKEVGINSTKQIARGLGVPYMGHSGHLLLRVGKQTYTVFGHHGKSSTVTPQGKVAAVLKMGDSVDVDIVMMAHVHRIDHQVELQRTIDLRSKAAIKKEKHYIITGSYVDYDEGYPEAAQYTPEELGTPALLLHGSEKKVSFIRNIIHE